MSRARITLAVPFHRGLDYLRECLQSAQAQTRPDFRLVVLDDRGESEPEAAARLVASFDDPRFECVRNPRNLGMAENWNQGLVLARTELVTLLHADDRLLPNYAETVCDLADRFPEAVASFCGAKVIGPDGERRFSLVDASKRLYTPRGRGPIVLRGEDGLAAVAAGDFIVCPTLCFRRAKLGEMRFAPRWRQVQDLDMTARLLLGGGLLVGAREAAYEYRRHPESATERQSVSRVRFEEELALLAEISERAEALRWNRAARVARRARSVKLHLLYRAVGDLTRGALPAGWAKLRLLLRHG